MDFQILGPVEVRRDGEVLPLGGTKRRALLAILVLHANEVVSSDRLIDELWAEHPPQHAAAALHNHVSRLRKLLGADVLLTTPGGYCLRVAPAAIDLNRFERLVGDADRAAALERTRLLREALDIWRGPALADVSFEPFAATATVRLEEARLAALERKIDADLELGRHADVVGDLESLVAQHPLRERLRAQLILALYRAGRQAEALEVYRETRRVLDEELGLDPSPELRELERAILRQDPSLAAPPQATVGSPVAGRRSTLALAFGALVVLAAAGIAAALALRASEPALVAAREPVQVTVATRAVVVTEAAPKARKATPKANAATTTQKARPRERGASRPNARVQTSPTAAVRTPPKATPAPAPAPTTTAPKRRPPLRLEDDFASGIPDPLIWHYVGRENGATFAATDGRLIVSVSPDATPDAQWNQVGGHVGTLCRFDGDFDARVDFELLDWPAGSNVYAGLGAIYANAGVMRQASSRWGDNYASWVIPANAGVDLADREGRLRVRREQGTIATYFWREGRWVRLARGTSRGAAVLALQVQADGGEFGRVPVRVAFDNFLVEAPDADCPPGADPRGE